ncbi:hypothetical protein [Streptomyces beihaiensis]|uniref:Uncharacterized protein n=1 Tax=Streptomyces beihaiensis TaxID=2984495 RepID=A0ABT3TV35_9ACTN|nr:hypothetical protein [Streptomyces beihaiensis]MCX3060361.1 hypothetical protein [Streptomyces beihaiensis]
MSFGQGGPQWGQNDNQWGAGNSGGTPDWGALAEASEARARKKRWMMIGGAIVATLAVGAVVAWGIVSANGNNQAGDKPADQLPSTANIPSGARTTAPSFAETTPPPPLDPNDFIDSAAKDKAPLTANTLFPGKTLTVGGRVYKKGATASTKNCASVALKGVVGLLRKHHCTQVIRATYYKGTDAVTVGVTVYDTKAQATKVRDEYDNGSVLSLPGDGVPTFCRTTVCRITVNSWGRYAYFTNGGHTDGKNATKKDTALFTLGNDLNEFVFEQIKRRGELQASAAADAG